MKKAIIIAAAVTIIIIVALIVILLNNNTPTPAPSSAPSPTSSSPPPTSILIPSPTPSPTPELIIIDNTPAEEYVDIEAGASNPANLMPWRENSPFPASGDCISEIIAIGFMEIDLENDGMLGFTWNELLQIEHESLQIGEVPEEGLLPRRRIQNRDAARVVANELLESSEATSFILKAISFDPSLNIWIFSFGVPMRDPGGWWVAYVVNGYNSQVIRVVIDA